MIAMIAAYDRNRVIGNNGRIPWQIDGEQRRFKELTMGNAVIMGRRTYEEIGRPLIGRQNIVLSSIGHFDGCINVRSLEEALCAAQTDDVYIAGGASIYRAALAIADKLYITEIDAVFDGDAFFPEFDEGKFVKTIERQIEGVIPYCYVTYTAKK